MTKYSSIAIFFMVAIACTSTTEHSKIDDQVLASLGNKYKLEFGELGNFYANQLEEDSGNVEALVGLAEAKVLLYVFGLIPREECMEPARKAYEQANSLDSLNSNVRKVAGILNYLDWNWLAAEREFKHALELDSDNLNARHWYSLWLVSMMQVNEAMAHSDTLMSRDINNDFRIGRASLHYFKQEYPEMIELMEAEIAEDPELPWAYDWLGMAYNGLEQHDKAISTYLKAFELSDGTVEVGAGLGHALGDAGEVEDAKIMTDYYDIAAKGSYLPFCQRSFIHISIGEHDKALALLEEAYDNKSWFLIFMQIEHWYDPIRNDSRFQAILEKMDYPNI